uniref:NADH dehydrogenase subunit 2 n=1 Tax=Parachordodes pustulosus TaxID=3049253 RepID=UPI002E78A870|nr:NADH dehydrogenase subunit 2 [Parachordodes pustulosus]WQH58897.1 NADH dehydrogenase subunit 2 [Parachordodes pustulosus]
MAVLLLSSLFGGSIFQIFSCFNYLVLWLWMSFNLIFLMILSIFMLNVKVLISESLMLYFIVQSISSLLFLIFSQTSFVEVPFLFFMIFLWKSGMAPLQNWFVKSSKMANWKLFLIFLTFQKIYPLWFLVCFFVEVPFLFFWSYLMGVIIFLLLVNVLVSCLAPLISFNLMDILIYSSFSYGVWLSLSPCIGKNFFLEFYLFYFLLIFYLLKNYFLKENFLMNKSYFLSPKNFLFLMFLSGFPVSLIFFMKIKVLYFLVLTKLFFFFITLMILNSVGYYNYFKMALMEMLFLWSSMKNWKKKNSLVLYEFTGLILVMPAFVWGS